MADDPLEAFPRLDDAVCRRYGIRGPLSVRRLAGGYANDVFKVDHAAPAPVVLHVKHPPTSSESMDWEHRQVLSLTDHVPEALPPMRASDGSTWFWHGDRAVWLVSWVDGTPATPADGDAVAEVLARVHASRLGVSKRPGHRRLLERPLPAVGAYPAEFDAWLPMIHLGRRDLSRLVERLERERRPMVGLTHNDLFEGNVLVRDGRVCAVLDWEEAELDWMVWDLASAMWSICSSPGAKPRPGPMNRFVTAYRSAGGPVPQEEDDLLVPIVRARLLLEVLRAPYDREPQWDQQLAKLRVLRTWGVTTG